jgi:hypothetical protein
VDLLVGDDGTNSQAPASNGPASMHSVIPDDPRILIPHKRLFPDAAPLSFSLANSQPTRIPDFLPPIIFLALVWSAGPVLTSAAALLPEVLACVGTYEALARVRGTATDVRERAETARRLITLCQTLHKRYQQLHSSCRRIAGMTSCFALQETDCREPKSCRCEVARRVAGGSLPRSRMAAERQSPFSQSRAAPHASGGIPTCVPRKSRP